MSPAKFSQTCLRDEVIPTKDEVIVAFPTNRLMGFSMWGIEGDAEDILLIFVLDTKSLQVAAWHSLP